MSIQSVYVEYVCPQCEGTGVAYLEENDRVTEVPCLRCAGAGTFEAAIGLDRLADALARLPDDALLPLAERLLRVLGLGSLVEQAWEQEVEEALR